MSLEDRANTVGEGPAGPWLTYDQLAAARGIDRLAAVKLALRQGWRRERDKSRIVHVQVPSDWLAQQPAGSAFEAAARSDRSPKASSGHAEHARTVERSMWREQLAHERQRADAAERERDHLLALTESLERRTESAEARADQAEEALAAERVRADGLAERLNAISRLLSSRRPKSSA